MPIMCVCVCGGGGGGGGGGGEWSTLHFKVKFYLKVEFWACPCDNLSPVSARITKSGQKMHISTVKIPVDLGRDKPSASVSILIVKAIFLTYWRCFCITFNAIVSQILMRLSLATDQIGLFFWSCWLSQRFAVILR